MKRFYFFAIGVLLTVSLFAQQAPQSFSYQAVVRGANNTLVTNKTVGMKISLLQGSESGTVAYAETHTPTTNENGLVSIAIGCGIKVSGNFATIDWSKGPYFVKTDIDPAGGTNYSLTTISQLLSVPYALYAENSKDEQKLSVSVTGDTLYLTNGNFVIIPGLSSANHKPTSGYGSNITDVEGNTYKTVYIGTQQWMGENLKTSKYSDGTTIPNITDPTQWSNLTTGAWAYYNNDAANNDKYGKLYNWYAVSPITNGNKNVCPTGWHVPTDAEWTILTDYLGGNSVAGGKMKEVGTTSWNNPNIDATNTSLFSALPGGYHSDNGDFLIGINGYWWSTTEFLINAVWNRILYKDNSLANRADGGKKDGFSVRCLRD